MLPRAPLVPMPPPLRRPRSRHRAQRNRAPVPALVLAVPSIPPVSLIAPSGTTRNQKQNVITYLPDSLRHPPVAVRLAGLAGSSRQGGDGDGARVAGRLGGVVGAVVGRGDAELRGLRVDHVEVCAVDQVELVAVDGRGVAGDCHGCGIVRGGDGGFELDVAGGLYCIMLAEGWFWGRDGRKGGGRGYGYPVDKVDEDDAEGRRVGVDGCPGDGCFVAGCEGGRVGGGGDEDGGGHQRRKGNEGGEGELHLDS